MTRIIVGVDASGASQAALVLSPEALSLIRSLLLCQLAEHADQMAEGRVTIDGLARRSDSDSVLERELAETSVLRCVAAVQDAREAVRRLGDGTYGICEACALPIPFQRLEAMPHARRCVTCPAAPAGFAD